MCVYSLSTWKPCSLYQPKQDLGKRDLCILVPISNLSVKQIVLLLYVSLKMFVCNFKRWFIKGIRKKGRMNIEVCGLKLQGVCYICLILLKILEKTHLHSWDVLCWGHSLAGSCQLLFPEATLAGNALDIVCTSCPYRLGADLINCSPKGLKFI